MKIKQVFFRALILGGALSLSGAIGLADTIKLKNGSVFKGKVVTLKQGEFTIVLDLGTSSRRSSSRMIIAVEDVESIDFEGAEASSVPGAGATETAAPATEPTATPAERRPTESPAVERVVTKETTPPPATETTEGGGSGSGATEKTVSVGASADWTSTEIRIQRGQRISVSANGEIDLGNNRRTGPNGTSLNDTRKLIPNRPTGGLIAVVGDDNDDFVYVGKSAEFTANHNGILFLSVNEGNLKDNNGAFVARVKVMPAK